MNQPHAEWLAAASAPNGPWLPLTVEADATRCGGKAANLSRMTRAGLPVPDGGVLGVDALEVFLDDTGLRGRIDARVLHAHHADYAELERIEADVRSGFEAARWPVSLAPWLERIAVDLAPAPLWAVRSSAVGEDAARASCAGLMDSVLGVGPGASLERAIKQVWASRWSARALAYEQTGRTRLGTMAVIVQQQIDPELAGVLFTRSPEPGAEHEMLCEYGRGLADRLVAGEVDPVRVRIGRDGTKGVTLQGVDGVPALGARTLRSLAAAARSVEQLFGGPQDIEFALDRAGKLWLVQARPITTPRPIDTPRRTVWSNANVNENFPAPISPLLYSVVAPGYSAYFQNLGRAFGLSRSRLARMQQDLAGIVGVHAGRLYYNLTAIHAVLAEAPFGERLCAWFDDFTGAVDPTPGAPDARKSFVNGVRDAFELMRIIARTTWQYLFIERRVRRFEACVDAYAAASEPARLGSLDMLRLRDLLRAFMDIRLRRWTQASLADAAAMVCYGVLKALVRQASGATDATSMHNDLLKGLSGLKSAEPVEALWQLARQVRHDDELRRLFAAHDGEALLACLRGDARFSAFRADFERYLECWGFRCSGELMLTVPSFQERPQDLIDIVRSYAAQAETAPDERLATQQAERRAATDALLAQALRRRVLPGLSWAPLLSRALAATQASIGLRERARFKQALLYSRLRRVALEIGDRLVTAGALRASDDVFFLCLPELDQWLCGYAMFPDDLRPLVELRRAAHARFLAIEPPDVLVARPGQYPDVRARPTVSAHEADCLRGASVCGGIATGKARVLDDVAQIRDIDRGDILVTRQTDPGWAPAFVAIGGLVLERGGMLSHGAILAREYGIPTVVGVAAATRVIASGSSVRVDGDRGEVHRVRA